MAVDALDTTLLPEQDVQAAPAAVLLAVDRLLTAGALYPMGHGRFAAAVQEYRDAASAAGGIRPVVLEAEDGVMRVQGMALGGNRRGLERLLGLFDKLGIARVRIDADATEDVLHTLATRLLRQRREADENGHLRQAVFEDLPAQVTVVPRTFRKQWHDGIDGRFLPVLEAILDDVERAFSDREAGRAARQTLENMFRVFLARTDRDGDAALCAPEDRAFFESMITSGPQAVCRALRAIIERDGDLTCLDELFDDSHEALAAAAAQRALQLLLDAMAGPDHLRDSETPEAEERRVDLDDGFNIPLAELQPAIDAIAADAEPGARIAPGDLAEEISIYLAILCQAAAPGVARRALAGLWQAAGRAQSTLEREFLREKARALLDSADTELLDQVLPRLAGPFRERGADAVADYWSFLAAGDPERTALVWPHVVLEMLHTEPETAMRGLALLQTLATEPAPERMRKEAARFEALSTFRAGTFSKALFARPKPVLYPMYAALLTTPLADTFGAWLQEGWSRLPDDTAGGLLVRVTGPYRPALLDLYRAVLDHATADTDAAPPRALLDAVHAAVDRLAGAERRQDWVPVALLVLGEWSPASSRRLLERVRKERRLLVWPAWPRPCRVAARAALELDAEGGGRGD